MRVTSTHKLTRWSRTPRPLSASIGSTPEDVVQTTIWVASSERTDLAGVWSRLRASPIAEALTTASTLVGVTCLGYPGQLVELDVVAICQHPGQ